MSALSLCPFCGSHNIFDESTPFSQWGTCRDCGAKAPNWNNRASPPLPQQWGGQTDKQYGDVTGTYADMTGKYRLPNASADELRHMLSRWVTLGKTDHMARWLVAETEALLNGLPHPNKPFDSDATVLPQVGEAKPRYRHEVPVPDEGSKSIWEDPKPELEWSECLRISDLADEFIRAFSEDPTEDNAVCMVREILRAAAPLGAAEVMQYAADKMRVAYEAGLNAVPAGEAKAVAPEPKLSVWYGAMPESNGKSNYTAILHRSDITAGITIARSEYPERVRYEADRMRYLIGEIDVEPFILDYDADKHSGYTAPVAHALPVVQSIPSFYDVKRMAARHGLKTNSFIMDFVRELFDQARPVAAEMDVLEERKRQKTIEGWTPEHDDSHNDGSLVSAAICYAQDSKQWFHGSWDVRWPWDVSWWKPAGKRRNLVKAAALLLAEIERIDRAVIQGKKP